jgi:hypothetical protein
MEAWMERFVFVVAVSVAVLFGLFSLVGHSVRVDFGDGFENGFGHEPEAIVETTAGALPAQVYDGSYLRIRHIAARVVVTPEDREDFSIEISNPGGLPMPVVRDDGDQIVIDGRLRGRVRSCVDGGAEIRGYERATSETMPVITIRAPRDLVLDRSGAGSTEIAALDSLELDFSDCGTATIADVANKLDVDLAGSGSVNALSARTLSANVAGSGSMRVEAVSDGADIDLAGSGQVVVASLTGSLTSDGAGSGSLSIGGGAITDASVDLAGSGDVEIAASVQTLDVSIVGSGDVDVANTVGDIDVDIAGSGSVSARAVTGAVSRQIWGSGDLRIGE